MIAEPRAAFTNRTYLITGGASGIGRATVEALLARGANVVACDINQVGLDSMHGALAPGDRARSAVVRMDVRVPASCDSAVRLALERFTRLDGAVCAAGYNRSSDTWNMALDEWNDVLQVNVTGCYLTARAAARVLEVAGSIVTFSSRIALAGTVGSVHYATSKAAILGLTKSLALELAPRKIRVNAVAPGLIRTTNSESMVPDQEMDVVARSTPLGRLGTANDVASTVCFLLSDDSSFLTGQTIHINGGRFMP